MVPHCGNSGDGDYDDSADVEGDMSLKPIEPGCLALYHAGPSAAIRYYPPRVVKVISGPADMGVGVCLSCHKSDGDCIVDGLPNGYNSVCSCVLTRIDGHDPDAEITETDKENEKCLSI